jgi:hypothetical protein
MSNFARGISACAFVCFAGVSACSKDETPPAPDSVRARAQTNDDRASANRTDSGGASNTGSSAALPPGHPPVAGSTPRTATPAGNAGAVPPGHPPMTAVPPAADANQQAAATGPKYDVPAGWQSQPPKSSMRKAEFILPRAEGDSEDGQLIMYYFGTGGAGAVDANIARWKGMFTTAEGGAVPEDQVKVSSTEANGLKATLLDVTGRYTDAMSGRAQASTEDFRMLAAILDTPEGPYFFKAVGPLQTMAGQKKAFGDFIASMRMK